MTTTVDPLPEVLGEIGPGQEHILTDEALRFVAELARTFEPRRRELLEARATRDRELAAGDRFDFLASTSDVRAAD